MVKKERSNELIEPKVACDDVIAMAKNVAESREKLEKAIAKKDDADEETVKIIQVRLKYGLLILIFYPDLLVSVLTIYSGISSFYVC